MLEKPALFRLIGVLILLLGAPAFSTAFAARPSDPFEPPAGARSFRVPVDRAPYFDIPITYNAKVKKWVRHFQGPGKKWFRTWLERSHRYLPSMQEALLSRGLPQDLAYVAMIESGFSAQAVSSANAVGYWQFIKPTASRYGLRMEWWLDERREYLRSTHAAASYLGDLYRQFKSWYLTAAAYNMGEGRMRRLIEQHRSQDYWILARKKNFPTETEEYIPKLLAAMLIAKAPGLYGFRNINPMAPISYEPVFAPGGTDLAELGSFLGLGKGQLSKMNPHLVHGFVPRSSRGVGIKVPKDLILEASTFLKNIARTSPQLPAKIGSVNSLTR